MKGRFAQVVGTGGIGAGVLFELEGNGTLRRGESRPAALSDARDYCKQHIILHYVAKVLAGDTRIYAIGKIGDDTHGGRLVREMREAGINTEFVQQAKSGVTMYSVCLQYPDKSVCNITTSNSASGAVDADYVRACVGRLKMPPGKETLVLAVPEVPLAARIALLEAGREKGAYCVASFVCAETQEFLAGGGFDASDLLVINEEEAGAFLGSKERDCGRLAQQMMQFLSGRENTPHVAMTCGEKGSYSISGTSADFLPGHRMKAVSTAGAGDAYTAGTICGLHFGLPLGQKDGNAPCAQEMGAAFAQQAVLCRHTIDPSIDRQFVRQFLQERAVVTDGI